MVFIVSVVAGAEQLPKECPEQVETSESSRELAGIWFSKGIEHASEEAFDEAEKAFRCSFKLVPHPASLLNVAKAAEHLGANDRAVDAYRLYLERFPEDERCDAVRKRIQQIASQMPAADVDTPSSKGHFEHAGPPASKWQMLREVARIEATAKRYANAIELFEAYLERGKHDLSDDERLEIETEIKRLRKIRMQESELTVLRNTTIRISQKGPLVQTEQAPRSKKERTLQWVGWTLLGTGGATLAASMVTGSIALSYDRDLALSCEGEECSKPSEADKIDSMERLGYATTALVSIGAVAVVAGATLLIISKMKSRRRRAEKDTSVSPQLMPGHVGIGLKRGF